MSFLYLYYVIYAIQRSGGLQKRSIGLKLDEKFAHQVAA